MGSRMKRVISLATVAVGLGVMVGLVVLIPLFLLNTLGVWQYFQLWGGD